MNDPARIEVRGLHFAYDEAGDTLHGVDLAVGHGERVAILGANGSGKSTLARCLNGLHRPSAGLVRVDGFPTTTPTGLTEVRRRLQMVFQNPENQQVGVTVLEDVAFGLANVGTPTVEMGDRVRAALELVALDVAFERDVATLSGGELQRLALAGVLALEPRYLVLDEATSMLDPGARASLLATLDRLHGTRGLGIVQITHDLAEVLEAQRWIVLDEGRVVADGSPDEVLRDGHLLRRCALESPGRALQPRRPHESATGADGGPGAGPPTLAAAGVVVHRGSGTRPARAHGVARLLRRIMRRPVATAARRRPTAGTTPVLDRVDLVLTPGACIAIAGPSGAGKSTLISALKGLLAPSAGRVLVGGCDPWELGQPELFDAIGYVFQVPERQLFARTVADDVAYALRTSKLDAATTAARVDAALGLVGIDTSLRTRSPFELSGGERRRVAIAGAVIAAPRVLLLDEPTVGLDASARRQLFAMLERFTADGIGIVWVTHRLDEAIEHADALVLIDRGRVAASGEVASVLASDAFASLGWPMPLAGAGP